MAARLLAWARIENPLVGASSLDMDETVAMTVLDAYFFYS